MVNCAVLGCNSNNNRKCKNTCKYRFFAFPLRKKTLVKAWIAKCGQNVKINVNTARICSKHFLDSDYQLKEKLLGYPKEKWKLNLDSIPSVHLPKETPSCSTSQVNRKMRAENKSRRQLVEQIMTDNVVPEVLENDPTNVEMDNNQEIEEFSLSHSIGTQTTFMDYTKKIEELEEENKQLKIKLDTAMLQWGHYKCYPKLFKIFNKQLSRRSNI
ncbi:hypothetical protein ABEB36_014630 [Hypothenemus hampei]|uniref:THAP-type domain-containing protein n=1 Tax=Hypothenemus hampei TaxID=57062 RepID=A0ABD1E2N1_HYPHA